jgi:hypothetical protein
VPRATVAILGSCISRDAFNTRFNPDYREDFECVLYQNHTSVLALMSPVVDEPWGWSDPSVPDGEREVYANEAAVRDELEKRFLDRLEALAPTYLMLDFFGDVHWGVIEVDSGRFFTHHPVLWPSTDLYFRWARAGRLRAHRPAANPETYFEGWSHAFQAFMAEVRSRVPNTRVVLHRGHNTNTVTEADGCTQDFQATHPQNLNEGFHPIPVELYNQLWRGFDDRAARSVDAAIDLTTQRWTTPHDHPWGPFYVHYETGYYRQMLSDLREYDAHIRGRERGGEVTLGLARAA